MSDDHLTKLPQDRLARAEERGNPDVLFLSPVCHELGDGRTWCTTTDGDPCYCVDEELRSEQHPFVKYVRADAAEQSQGYKHEAAGKALFEFFWERDRYSSALPWEQQPEATREDWMSKALLATDDDKPAARARFILALAKLEVAHDVDFTDDEIDALVEAIRG